MQKIFQTKNNGISIKLDDWEFDLKSEMPDWCPIKPVPERACHEEYWDNGRCDKGWNECLEAILKGRSEYHGGNQIEAVSEVWETG